MKQWAALCVMLLVALVTSAQDQPKYLLELGGGAGLGVYEGDFNDNLLKSPKPMGQLVARYKPNPRMAWAADIAYGKLKGSSKNAKTWYPDLTDNPVDFSTSLVDFAVRYEYNFWPFGTGREYHGASILTPFIAVGVGLSFASAENGPAGAKEKRSSVAGQIPIGLGVKYKVADRLNLTAEWMMHFTGNDKIDGVVDPYGIESSGLFKNTDCYSVLAVSLTYDLWAKCKTCHNDRE